jgi:polyisoprenoid-binding protein YceI
VPDVLPIAVAVALLASAPSLARAADGAREATAGDYVLDGRTAALVIRLTGLVGIPAPTLRLTKVEGRLRYDPDRPEAASVSIRADPRSIEASRNPVARRAKAQFEPEKYSTISFTSTTLTWNGARGEARGELTFHGVTRPMTLSVALVDSHRDSAGAGEERVRFSGHGRLKRTEFGLTEGAALKASGCIAPQPA